MAKQDLHRSQIARRLVDDRRLRAPQRVGAVILASQPDANDPLINQSSILTCAQMLGMISWAREHIVVGGAPASLKPSQKARARCFEQLDLNGPTRLSLHHGRP